MRVPRIPTRALGSENEGRWQRPPVLKRGDMTGQINCEVLVLQDRPGQEMSEGDSRRRVAGWFNEWQRPLRRFIASRRAIPPRDLDDVAQEVFLRLMRYGRAEFVENPQAYLFKTAANVATEWSIRYRTTGERELAWLEDNGSDNSTDGDVGRLETEEEIVKALLALRPRQREVLKLQFFEGLSHAQTAERLGVTERVVKRALAKSYQRLRRQLLPP